MAGTEARLVDFILDTDFNQLPPEVVEFVKKLILTNLGTAIAGATLQGCETLVDQIRDWGGKEEATLMIYGGKAPAHNATFVNSYMTRALDADDGIRPGMHVGSSAVPSALAAAELASGCSGKKLIAALALGGEIANRINLISDYDGFDPTGICTVFAVAAASAKILGFDREKMWNALAIAFNKSGGSFQSNVEGTLSVRLIQGFTSQNGILAAQLAEKGFTGPRNFLEGVYGYFHLYAGDRADPSTVTGNLGKEFHFLKTMFKKYPSCGSTISSTEAALALVEEHGLTPENVDRIHVRVSPYSYKLVGGPFSIGENPTVNAQFNIHYCVANALLRGCSRLEHFEESQVRDPRIMEIVRRIRVEPDEVLGERDETTVELDIQGRDGATFHKRIDFAAGFHQRPLTSEEILERFRDCVQYAKRPLPGENVEKLISSVQELEKVKDVRTLVDLMMAKR